VITTTKNVILTPTRSYYVISRYQLYCIYILYRQMIVRHQRILVVN